MSDRIIDRISALQDEIGQGRRRIEKLEAALMQIFNMTYDGDPVKGIARAALSIKEDGK